MIKEAIDRILEISAPRTENIDGNMYSFHQGRVEQIRPQVDVPAALSLNSLDALVKLVETEGLSFYTGAPLYITVPSPTAVTCFLQPSPSLREIRLTLYDVTATDIPGWAEKVTLSFEEAMIALRTRFQDTTDTPYVLKLLSEITTGAKMTLNDNGIATTVVTKKGIDLQSSEVIRPIVTLRPYRTFQEVEQPASQFLIRVSDKGISFVEADGGMWKLEAKQTIVKHLEAKLESHIEAGSVVLAI